MQVVHLSSPLFDIVKSTSIGNYGIHVIIQ
jgi:hypothetical protein